MGMTLIDVIDLYGTVRRCSAGYLYQLSRSVGLYGEHLDRPATVEDLADVPVSRWLAILERTHAQRTVAGHRANVLILWRFAARRHWCDPPGEVRRVPRPAPMPEAWTVDEMTRLVAATDELDGSAGRWFRALILAGYESGLRRADLWGLHRSQIHADGITIRQHKTGQPHLAPLRPETSALVLALPGDHPLACPWGPKWYGVLWGRLRRLAGVSGGCCQKLRRTGATWIAATEGMDAASRWLGHRTPGMVRYYVDLRFAAPRPSLPPRVGGVK
jgi:integrase